MSGQETCHRCGKTWGVTMKPREAVLCTACAATPRLPEGEVRVSPDGVIVVCLGSGRRSWKVIGHDPHDIVTYGWRYDWDVIGWAILGNVYDLRKVA